MLDANLPGMDGFTVLRHLRASGSTTPVLLVTARSAIDDRVSGLGLGADDYLVKPFDYRGSMRACRRSCAATAATRTTC